MNSIQPTTAPLRDTLAAGRPLGRPDPQGALLSPPTPTTGTGPLISVVIPAHNGARWLREAAESVLSQEGVDLELVIADHGSTDDTQSVMTRLARSDSRVRLVTLPPGGGAEAGWNGATSAATGTYLKLLCQDDSLQPGVLARQAQLLNENPDAALTACRRDLVDAEGRTMLRGWGLKGFTTTVDGATATRRAILQGTNPFGEPGCVLMRRTLLLQVGGWDGQRPYVIDLATYFKLLTHGSFVPDLTTGAVFRVSHQQVSFDLRHVQARQVRALHRDALAAETAARRWPLMLAGALAAAAAQTGRRVIYRLDTILRRKDLR